MRVALFTRMSRTHRRRGGGIFRTGQLYAQAAEATPGLDITLFSENVIPNELPDEYDLVWLYGDHKKAANCLEIARKAGVPMLLLSNYNGRRERSKTVSTLAHSLDGGRGDFYLQVFTHMVTKALPNAVMVPQPVQFREAEGLPEFEERKGVCFGEVAKLIKPQHTGRWPVQETITRLTEAGYECWAYRQYSTTRGYPEGLHVHPYQDTGMLDWLATMRVFVHLTKHETFAMVPLEALRVGTPVLFQNMPQSHSTYLGHAGIQVEDVDDVVAAVAYLHDPVRWASYSQMAQRQGGVFDLPLFGAQLHQALDSLIRRHRAKSLEQVQQ